MTARITLTCPSGDDDCTSDCGRCKGEGVVMVPVNEGTVARAVVADFRSFERHEMPPWPGEGEQRDRELVAWMLRCLANPRNGWSVPALAAIVQQAEGRAPAQPVMPARNEATTHHAVWVRGAGGTSPTSVPGVRRVRPHRMTEGRTGWIFYTCRLTGTLDHVTLAYSWDGTAHPSRGEALDAGFRAVGSDDFNVGRIEDDHLVWHGWMSEEHPADERTEVVVGLGLRPSDDAPADDDRQAPAAARSQS